MKKSAEMDKSKAAVNLKVGGKKISELVADDLDTISFDQIEKARETQVQRERQEKIRLRKMESKRVDHIARAMREEERPLLDNWADDVEDEDQKFLDRAEAKNADAQEQAHEEGLKEKTVLMVFQSKKDDWVASKMKDRKLEHRKAMRQKQEELDQKA